MALARILVAEDEWIVAADLCSRVEQLGYEVIHTAYTGAEAIAKTLELHPDLLLLDIHLRDALSGIEVAQEVLHRFEVPIIFITAYADRETLDLVKAVGSFDYLMKPFEEPELQASLARALQRRRPVK